MPPLMLIVRVHAMALSYHTQQRLKIIVIALVICFVVVGVVAFLPGSGKASYSESYFRWLVGIPSGLVAWGILEYAGSYCLALVFGSVCLVLAALHY